jgi:hypothetical protein
VNRPQSRTQIRKSAARAFHGRNRLALSVEAVREPEPGETALSRSEVAWGVREGLIAAVSAHARAFAPPEKPYQGASA